MASSSSTYPATSDSLIVETHDSFPLSANLFRPLNGQDIKALLVIANATGVQARFYHDFARWASKHGVLALTFDYRYSGFSFPPKHLEALRRARAKGEDGEEEYADAYDAALLECPKEEDLTETWARKDLKAIVLHARQLAKELTGSENEAARLDLTIMGHSLGGHLHVLLDPTFVSEPSFPSAASSRKRVNRFMTVCSGNAHWRNHPQNLAARFAMEELVARPLYEEGIFRCANLGLGFDLPHGPGSEWLAWYMHPLFSLERKGNEKRGRENTRTTPFAYYGFDDDDTMDPIMMDRYLAMLDCSTCNVQSLRIDPRKESDWPRCGHVNAFQPGNGAGMTDDDDDDKAMRGGEAYQPTDLSLSEDHSGKTSSRPGTKTREETIWPIFLAYILEGQVNDAIGRHKVWTSADECDRDALREQEIEAREKEAREEPKRRHESEEEDEGDEEEDADAVVTQAASEQRQIHKARL